MSVSNELSLYPARRFVVLAAHALSVLLHRWIGAGAILEGAVRLAELLEAREPANTWRLKVELEEVDALIPRRKRALACALGVGHADRSGDSAVPGLAAIVGD
jgi:hypothetical protein